MLNSTAMRTQVDYNDDEELATKSIYTTVTKSGKIDELVS